MVQTTEITQAVGLVQALGAELCSGPQLRENTVIDKICWIRFSPGCRALF